MNDGPASAEAARLDVYLLPELIPTGALRGRRVVIVDVLRATTTIATALAHGARRVLPCLEVEQALAAAAARQPRPLLGGERAGRPIAGFDLGNSPTEYLPQVVAGRELVFTTTNGTRALLRCGEADQVLLASFVNLGAVAQQLASGGPVAVVCSGTDGELTGEDALLAGALGERLAAAQGNDQATLVRRAWPTVAADPLVQLLADSQGGRNLLRLGLQEDLQAAAAVDQFSVVPRWDQASGTIVC